MTDIYMHDSKYAVEHGERKLFFDSRSENLRVKYAIEETISENFDGAYLNKDCIKPILEDFGWTRVKYVLAATVRKLYWDGRFSRENKWWAKEIAEVLEDTVFMEQDPITSHPVILNAFINMCRKEME